jgi:hypothetical protein
VQTCEVPGCLQDATRVVSGHHFCAAHRDNNLARLRGLGPFSAGRPFDINGLG